MTREEFDIQYRRALTRSDWATALRVVDERIDYATDDYELRCLKMEFDELTKKQPVVNPLTAWWGRRRKVTG